MARHASNKKTKVQHSQAITHLAQAQNKPAEKGPRYRLTIDKKDYTHVVDNIAVNYGGDGQSGMTFQVNGVLEGLGDSIVTLHMGYGNEMVEYFTGKLEEPDDDEKTFYSQAVAYGPFKLMGTQYFDEWTDYSGWTLGQIIHDLARRAGFPGAAIKVVNPGSFTALDLSFNEESTLLEAAQKVIKDANYIFVDRPGYGREAKPKPRPAVGMPSKAHYDETHYSLGDFSTKPQAVSYSQVIVFHRASVSQWSANQQVAEGTYVGPGTGRIFKAQNQGTSGATAPSWSGGTVTDNTVTWKDYAADPAGATRPAPAGGGPGPMTSTQAPPFDDIRAVAKVRTPGKHRPPKNRTYFVPDFAGTQAQAQKMAHLTAEQLTHGLFDFELKVDANPSLFIYDSIKTKRVKMKGNQYWRQEFQSTMDKTIAVTIKSGEFSMTLSGSAVQLKESRVHVPKLETPPINPALLVRPSVVPFTDWSQTDIFLSEVAVDYSHLPGNIAPPWVAFLDWGQQDMWLSEAGDYSELIDGIHPLYPSPTLYPSTTLYPSG